LIKQKEQGGQGGRGDFQLKTTALEEKPGFYLSRPFVLYTPPGEKPQSVSSGILRFRYHCVFKKCFLQIYSDSIF